VAKRPALDKGLGYLREGDTLVITKLDRLGRSVRNLKTPADDLQAREVGLRALSQGIDTTTPGGRLFFHLLAAIVQVVDAATREGYQALLDRADIGLSPLRLNALWNMAIVDLMATGRPAPGYRYGAIPEIVEDPSMLFNDREDFLAKAIALVSDPDLIRIKGEEAQQRSAVWAPQRIAHQGHILLSPVLANVRG